MSSEDEWYKAAYYKGGSTSAGYWDYPTSSDTKPGQDMADVSGNNAIYWYANSDVPYPIDSGKFTTLVGEFQNSPSPYGTFDQGGNVFEWNEAILHGSMRGLRGGEFGAPSYNLLAAYREFVSYNYPTNEGSYIGFRVANVPEPGSLVLLVSGAIGLLVWAWRLRKWTAT